MRVLFPTVVTVLVLLVPSRAGPISSLWGDNGSQCARQCIASSKFQYARGTTYEFDYLAETSTSMEDASEDTARLSISATAFVHVISDCDMVLQLRDVSVKESDPNSQSMRSAPDSSRAAALLQRQPLRFSFQDGVVEELCPSGEEALWALNVKRGVLSAFQNSMSRLDSDETVTEVDVAGRCPSQYQVENKGWYSTTVKRSKDLLACTGRHDYQTAVTATPYHTPSSVQSLPLLKSSHHCQQTVNQQGILSSATCTELHQFRPFSREASGAVTKVTQNLKYRTQTRSPVTVQPVSQRVSLMYDHGSQEEISHKAQQEAEEVLRQLCRDTQTDIRPDTPRLFSSLVSALRKVDSSSLQTLYSSLEQNTLCSSNIRTKKFFVDALPMVGTDATVAMMMQMLTNNDVTGLEADMWLTSLALIQEPSSAMLEQVKSVLTSKTLGQKALLPVSTMVNNFCQHQPQCSTEPSVQAIMTSFEDVIGSSCYVNKKNIDQALMGLRAIGNAGHVSSSVSVVNQCVRRSKNPMEIRVSAAQAFRRMPCDADRSTVTSVMEDRQEDSELRIAAYLAVMTCPDDVTLQRVQRLLESETDQQVGSFVWSHLTNLQETSSPHKQAVRQLLTNVQLPASFDLGRLQFSRNYEGSAFLKRLNSGAAAESSLVWSSSSSLPRSLAANLTVDLFGRSLNLMDFGLRAEGLEYILETMLGPSGYFGQSGNQKGSQLDELKGSLYLRMLGNEVTFQRFQGLDSFSSATSFNLLDFLIKLSKDHHVSMTHSTEFLDTKLTVPTSCGLPLSLTVQGTATVDLQASGTMDLRKMTASPSSLTIDGEIRPSGAIRVSGQMAVDGHVSRAALHVTGTMHSSSALKGRVDLDRGRVLSVELDVPEEKMELLEMSSEFSIVHNKVEKKQKMITENRQTVKLCTGQAASRITGLELCGEVQFPNASSRQSGPYFPFTGPSSLSLALYKRDTHTSYKLFAKRVENKKKMMAQLSLNTPGSQVDRSLSLDLNLNHVDRQIEVSAASPWKKAEFKGAITNNKKLVGISGSVVTDDVNVYALTSEVKMDQSRNGVTYTPLLEIRRPGVDTMALTGSVAMDTRAATVDLSLTGVTAQPLKLKSALTNNQREISLTGSVANGDKQEYSVRMGTQMNIGNNNKSMKLQVQPFLSVKTSERELVSVSGSALYNEDKILKADITCSLLRYKPLTAQLTATKSDKKNSARYVTKGSVRSGVVSGSVSSTVTIKRGRLVSGRAVVSYNMPRVVRDRLELTAKLSDRSTSSYLKYSLKSSVESKSFPDYNTVVKMNVDHKKKLSSAELAVKYGKDPKDNTKRLLLSATVARKVKDLRNVYLNYKMEAQAPKQNIDVKIEGKHSHDPSSLESKVALTLDKSQDVSVSLNLENKSSKLKKLNGELKVKAAGKAISLKSALNQVSKKQWEHSMVVQSPAGNQHSLTTVYHPRGRGAHQMTTTLDLQGRSPLVLSGQVNTDWEDLTLTADLQQDNKVTYGVSAIQKLAKSRNGKWNIEVTVPSRRVTLKANAGKVKGNYEGSMQVAWDADKDKSAKVEIEGLVGSKSSKDHSLHKARLSLTTPIQGYTHLETNVALDSGNSQHTLSTKLVLGEKKKVITSTLMVATPLILRDFDLAFKAETPYRGYGSMGMTLVHKLDTGLATKLTLTLQKEQCEITLTAQNRGTEGSRDVQAQLDLQSTFRRSGLRSVSVSAGHTDHSGQLKDSILLKVNNKVYSCDFHMQLDTGSHSGDLTLTWPKDQIKASWTHRHSSTDLRSSLTSTWSSSKRLQVDLSGSHLPGSLSGSLALQSPWQQDLRAEMSTEYGSGRIMSSSSVKKQDREAFSHSLLLTVDAGKTDMEFSMTSPWTEPISSKVNVKYQSFPMSASAELSWEPRKTVIAEGSIIVNNWDDLDITVKVTTPVRQWRSLAAQVSNKVEGQVIVGQAVMDLGMRKNVHLTTRLQRDASGVRVKLTTPWDDLRVLDTGVDMNVQSEVGKVKADFKAIPLVGQYEGSATWDVSDNVNARLRVDTPRQDFPYLQILVSSKDKRRVRQSRVELEYSPRQTYSLESTYSFDLPVVLDINVATPLEGYESMSAAFRHNLRDTAMDASAQVTYSNDKTVKMTTMMDWSRGLDSSVTVTSPFPGWEQSSATLRHEGDWNDFNSLTDVTVGGQGVTGSLKFLHKMKTDVQLTLTTPWAGWEKIEAALARKGDLSNLRGTASLVCSEQKMEANVMTKWNSRKAHLVASLTTPFSQDLKLHVEQNAAMQTKASLSYGRQYSLDTASSLTVNSREVSASTNIKYRAGGPRRLLTASVAKVGSLQDLALTASASLDNQQVSLTAELHTLQDIKAALALTTPFSQFERMGASFSHARDLSGMTTEVNAEYMTDRNIHGKMEVAMQDLEQVSFRGTFTTPLSGLERGAVSVSHTMRSGMWRGSLDLDTTVGDFGTLDGSYQATGHLDNVKAESRVTYNNGLLLDASLGHKLTSSRLLSSLHVATSVWPELTVDVNHQGNLHRFTTKASAAVGGDKVSSDTQWSSNGDNVDLNHAFHSRLHNDVNQASVMLSKVGPLSQVTVQLSGNVNADQAKMVGKLSTSHDISASLEVELPVEGYRQMGASFQKTGDYRDMSVTAAANLERQKVDVVSRLTQDSEVTGSLDINTPFTSYNHMGAAFSYGGENAMISGHLQNDKIEGTGRFVNTAVTQGNVDITTPFDGYKKMGASFNYDGENAKISGNLQDEKIEANGRFVNGDAVEGSLEVATPFYGYRQMGAAFNYGGENVKLSGNLENDKIEANGRFVNSDTVEGSLEVTTPFNGYRQMEAAFNYDGENAKISGNLESDKVEAIGRFINGKNIEGSLEVTTPFDGYRQTGGAFNYDGENARFSGNLEDDKVEATGRFVNGDSIEGQADITTPFNGYQKMGASFTYGNGNAMISGQLQNDRIVATGRYVTGEGSLDIKTPFRGYRQMGASLNYDPHSLTATANLQNDKIEASAKYDNADDVTGSLRITTPFTGYTQLGGQFRYSRDLSDVTVTISGHVESCRMEVTGKFLNGQEITGSLEIATPFRGYRNMGSSFTLTGDLSDMTFTADASLQRDKVEVKAALQTGSETSGSVTVLTPFTHYRSMGASFRHSGDLSVQMAAHLMDERLEARATLSRSQALSGSVSLDTPWEGFRQLGGAFKHTGTAANFNSEGQVTYMDGQTISGKVKLYNHRLRRVEASAELTTPFPHWEMTKLSYKHAGKTNKFECNAMLECNRGQQHTADLKVDMRRGQNVQLTVKTPYDGFRMTDLTHSLSQSAHSVQWSGAVTYGEAQTASSKLTVSYPNQRFTSTFDLQTPFISELAATFDFKGQVSAHSMKTMVKYGNQFQFSDNMEFQMNDSPLLLLKDTLTYTIGDISNTQSISLRCEGPWNDVTVSAKGQRNGEEIVLESAFKKDFGRMEANVKINTPFEGYRDVGASVHHVRGEVSGVVSTEGTVQYRDGEEVSGKLDLLLTTWRRLQVTAQLTTPLEDWTHTRVEYRHQADEDGVTCHTGVEYLQDQQLTGDLRVTSSPHPKVTLTMKTPWTNWEQMSASGSVVSDGLGHREVSSNVDLGGGQVYTLQSTLSVPAEDKASAAIKSFTARLTTPHADWHSLEARASLQGGLDHFQTSAYFSCPRLEALSASASARYNSLFDLTAAASLDIPLEGIKGWKMEVVNGERGNQKNSHVTLGWSGDQEVMLDGTWRHNNRWYERHLHAEVSMTSPFEAVRRTGWLLEHHSTQGQYTHKMTGSLNGDKLVDLDLDTQTGDLPKVTLILNEPYAMQYSAARTSEGGDLSLNWDRNDPNSNLHMTSHFTGSSDPSNLKHDLDLKITNPSRTVGAKYSLQSSSLTTTSQGELYWGSGSNRRLFYTLQLNDLSRRSISSYECKLKVGAWSRAVQVSGAVTHSPLSRLMDATLHWDADHDDNKQVTLKTRWTSGDRNKADLTLSLPSINQEVRVQSEVAVNQGRTLLDSTTALTYSPDSRKVLTFTSTLKDTTGAWESSASNYTLHLSLTHPHTDLDLSMTSHLGATEDRYSAAIDTWYLTSGRQRKNMALRGEIDQLRRQLTMEMVSPVKKVVMKGEVKSVDPYSLSLTNRYDDDVTTHTDVTLDTNKRSFSFKTNYDLDHPERSLNIKAGYVNDTAIKAEVYRDHVTDVITDALLALRLNTSTLLHSRLHWRPSSLSDLQAYSVAKLSAYAFHSKQSMQLVNEAVREELAARYSRSAAAVAQDLAPWMDLVHTEMQEVASQLQTLRRQLTRVYRRHPMLQDMGSAAALRYRELMHYVAEVSDSYQQKSEALSQQMKDAVQTMTQFPVGERYQQYVQALIIAFEEVIDSGVDQLTQAVMSVDNYLQAVRQRSVHMANYVSGAVYNVSSHPYVHQLTNSLDITPYLQGAGHRLGALRMPDKYTAALYRASSDVTDALNDVMQMERMSGVKETSNELYQQGLWAYHYWEVEENLKKHLHSIATLLKEIVQEEMEIYTRHFRFLQQSHVTVWDPEHGEVQAETHLPVAMETLDSMPDVTPLVTQYQEVMKSMPDMDTVQYFYDQYVPESSWWSSNNTSQQTQLMSATPSSRGNKAMREKFYNRRNSRVATL
ncbi:hypothetical protein ACOMHN_057558 [Nucella lapillus]